MLFDLQDLASILVNQLTIEFVANINGLDKKNIERCWQYRSGVGPVLSPADLSHSLIKPSGQNPAWQEDIQIKQCLLKIWYDLLH